MPDSSLAVPFPFCQYRNTRVLNRPVSSDSVAVSEFRGFAGVARAFVAEPLSNYWNLTAIEAGRGFAGGPK